MSSTFYNPSEEEQDLTDEEFMKKHSDVFFKTMNKSYGDQKVVIKADKDKGINGKFTNHLLAATMYRNHSLNVTADKERWVEGSKDWMEHLN